MPLSNYYEMDPRQYAGMSEAEMAALGMAPGMLNASPSAQAAFNMASNLGNLRTWGGSDLAGVGGLSPFSGPSPVQLGGFGGGQGGQPPGASPQPSGGGGMPPVNQGFGFAGSAYQGGQAPPPQAPQGSGSQLVQQRRLPMPFQAAVPAASASS